MRLLLNGKTVSEGSFNAAVAAEHFCQATTRQLRMRRRISGPIETVATKRSLSFSAGIMISPSVVVKSIHDGVARGLQRRGESHPAAPAMPGTLEWRFNNVTQAEMVSYVPGATRVDGYSVRFMVANMMAASKLVAVSRE
jgi:D-aminopeptidase